MKIIIKLLSDKINVNILIGNGKFILNGTQKKVNIDLFVDKLLRIVGCWKENMVNNKIIGGDSYEVQIFDGKKTVKYSGYGEYPLNYFEFVKLINEVAV